MEMARGRKLYWCPVDQADQAVTPCSHHEPQSSLLADVDEVKRLIRENPWATLVEHGDGLVASHYPVVLDEGADEHPHRQPRRPAGRAARTSSASTKCS